VTHLQPTPRFGRKHVARLAVAAAAAALFVLLFPWKQCRDRFGSGGGTGESDRLDTPGVKKDVRSGDSAPSPDAGT